MTKAKTFIILGILGFLMQGSVSARPSSETSRYRLVWTNDPTTTCTIGWEQDSGNAGTVHYGKADEKRDYSDYKHSKSVDREVEFRGMNNCFANLSNLDADTKYYFVIKDAKGVSERYWFRTASVLQNPFTFIAGGDSRNNRVPRRKANRMVAKLRPLFVAFTGDMIASDKDKDWQQWFDDWQDTTSSDGRMYPILPHRGNHETGGNETLRNLFDSTRTNYYALNFSGNLMRYYVLNSEITEGGDQGTWLDNDLTKNAPQITHLTVGYHKPMRPHEPQKDEGTGEYNAWASLFYKHGVDLAFESDSHVMKRTAPIKPSTGSGNDEGFIAANGDANATVYVGEGCWGAPMRLASDTKDWTIANASFNGFDWMHVQQSGIEVRTVKVDNEDSVGENSESNVFASPKNLSLWEPTSGTVLSVPADGGLEEPVTSLTSGTPIKGLAGAKNDKFLFSLNVPELTSHLKISLKGGRGNANLYVKPASSNASTLSSATKKNSESISVINPAPGSWTIMVRGASAFKGAKILAIVSEPVSEDIFAKESSWKYFDTGSDLGDKWRSNGFDDSTWPSGNGQLGHGDQDEQTDLKKGRATYYFRKQVTLKDVTEIAKLTCELIFDDGAIVYLNGTEVYRTSTMPKGPVRFDQYAESTSSDNDIAQFSLIKPLLREGSNVIAVELHNQSKSSSDVSFDLSMSATRVPATDGFDN